MIVLSNSQPHFTLYVYYYFNNPYFLTISTISANVSLRESQIVQDAVASLAYSVHSHAHKANDAEERKNVVLREQVQINPSEAVHRPPPKTFQQQLEAIFDGLQLETFDNSITKYFSMRKIFTARRRAICVDVFITYALRFVTLTPLYVEFLQEIARRRQHTPIRNSKMHKNILNKCMQMFNQMTKKPRATPEERHQCLGTARLSGVFLNFEIMLIGLEDWKEVFVNVRNELLFECWYEYTAMVSKKSAHERERVWEHQQILLTTLVELTFKYKFTMSLDNEIRYKLADFDEFMSPPRPILDDFDHLTSLIMAGNL